MDAHFNRNIPLNLLGLLLVCLHSRLCRTSRPERGNGAKWRPFLALSHFSALRYLTQLLTKFLYEKMTL